MDQLKSFLELLDRVRTPKATLEDLIVKLKHVISLEGDAKRELQEAVSSGKKPKRAAKIWMRTAKGLIMDSQEIREEVSRMGWIAQIVNIPIKRRMEVLIKQLVDLSEDRVLQDGLILDTLHLTRRIKFHTPRKFAGIAFERHLDQIWAWLVQDGVPSIGIYGLGGVGKTTLAKCVYNKSLQRRNPIQNVFWIDSSQIVDVRDLQVAIAKPLHLDILALDDEAARATLLSKTLKRKRECIVFLDGMYADISPDDVGIPLKKSRCRLIVTSRSVDVPRKMGCEKIIEMKPLVNEEDWSLFMEKLGGGRDLNPEIQRIAKLIVKKCSGIPLAINVMATSMRGVVDICEWKNALNELEKSPMGGLNNDMEKKVLPVLRLSFDRLNDSEPQQCFIMCALYPNRMDREDLIHYLISTGSMRRMQNWKEDFERGCTIINRLIGSCLLKKWFNSEKYLFMNGLIRDMAINVLKTSPDMMVKVSEIPEEKEWTENLKMAYLFLDDMISIRQLGVSPTCSKLRTLVCRLKQLPYMPDSLPDSFFLYMPALEVLDLSDTGIKCLPSSFSSLKNLTALLLKGCKWLKYVPSLKEVEYSLKFLDASGSGIIEVPDGLERLVNLIHLNLSELSKLPIQVFPLGILPKLTKLEYLKVSGNLTVEGKELEGLERLSTFEGRLSSLHSYNSYVMSRQYHGPKNYMFKMGVRGEEVMEYIDNCLNCVRVSGCKISKRGRLPIVLPTDVETLDIIFCGALTSLCDVPSLENAMGGLKKCSIQGCNDVSHVACFSSSCHLCRSHFFQTLEGLILCSLPQLSAIFGFDDINGKASAPVIAPATFSCLKDIFLMNCPKMKSLFQPELLPYLQNLEEIRVKDCEALEEIIEAASSSSNNCEYSLPKLTHLRLVDLPNLKSICGGRITCDALEQIEISDCLELKRIPLSPPPSSLRSIKGLESNREWWESVEWDSSSSTAKDDLQDIVDYTDNLDYLSEFEDCEDGGDYLSESEDGEDYL